MKLIDGIFKYNETVTVDKDGNLYKRKVHYLDGELFINIDGERITEKELDVKPKWDAGAYNQAYHKEHTDRFSIAAPKGTKDIWKAAAAERGLSLNAFVIECVNKEIGNE